MVSEAGPVEYPSGEQQQGAEIVKRAFEDGKNTIITSYNTRRLGESLLACSPTRLSVELDVTQSRARTRAGAAATDTAVMKPLIRLRLESSHETMSLHK